MAENTDPKRNMRILEYVEDEMDPRRRRRFEAELARDPELQRLVWLMSEDRSNLRRLATTGASNPADEPAISSQLDDMLEDVESQLERAMLLDGAPATGRPRSDGIGLGAAHRRRERFNFGRLVAYGAVAAMLVLGAGITFYLIADTHQLSKIVRFSREQGLTFQASASNPHAARRPPGTGEKHETHAAAPAPAHTNSASKPAGASNPASALPQAATRRAGGENPSRNDPAPAPRGEKLATDASGERLRDDATEGSTQHRAPGSPAREAARSTESDDSSETSPSATPVTAEQVVAANPELTALLEQSIADRRAKASAGAAGASETTGGRRVASALGTDGVSSPEGSTESRLGSGGPDGLEPEPGAGPENDAKFGIEARASFEAGAPAIAANSPAQTQDSQNSQAATGVVPLDDSTAADVTGEGEATHASPRAAEPVRRGSTGSSSQSVDAGGAQRLARAFLRDERASSPTAGPLAASRGSLASSRTPDRVRAGEVDAARGNDAPGTMADPMMVDGVVAVSADSPQAARRELVDYCRAQGWLAPPQFLPSPVWTMNLDVAGAGSLSARDGHTTGPEADEASRAPGARARTESGLDTEFEDEHGPGDEPGGGAAKAERSPAPLLISLDLGRLPTLMSRVNAPPDRAGRLMLSASIFNQDDPTETRTLPRALLLRVTFTSTGPR